MKYFVSFFDGRIFCGEPVPTSPENALVEVIHTTVLGMLVTQIS